jgi:uncharacterized repeat protein (TIGR03803 family)
MAMGKTNYSYKEKLLTTFNGTDGAAPYSSLIPDNAGNFYGTTSRGGLRNVGNVFEVSP